MSASAGAHCQRSAPNAHQQLMERAGEKVMLTDFEVRRAADAMMQQFGDHAELQAAKYADLMLGHSNRAGLLIWAKIWRVIAEVQPAPKGLPH